MLIEKFRILKRLARQADQGARRPMPVPVVPVHISDSGVASVLAQDVLNTQEFQNQLAVITRLRLASEKLAEK